MNRKPTVADIQQLVPSWPVDVIEQWLVRISDRPDTGWPPPFPLPERHVWRFILMRRPLVWWQEVVWQLEDRTISLDDFSPLQREAYGEMAMAYLGGARNSFSSIEDGKSRFLSALDYVQRRGTLPRPILLTPSDGGLRTVDGNHRALALLAWSAAIDKQGLPGQRAPQATHWVWIGRHPAGQLAG